MFGWKPAREETAAEDGADQTEGMSAEEKLLRLAAELENVRRRARRDTAQAAAQERHRLLTSLLPVLDNFDRALASPGADGTVWLDGMRGVHAQLLGVLESHGARPFGAPGELFDPIRHEAIAVVPATEEGAPDRVAEVQLLGYETEDGTILRPAQVIVEQSPQ